MPCVLSQGMTIDCRDSIGGVKAVWFIAHGNVSAVTEASGIVSAITKTGVFYKYNLVKSTASFVENINVSVENGSVGYAPELNIVLNKMQANTRNEIMLLAQNVLMAIVQDMNGKYWLLGKLNGLDISAGTAGTGTAMTDRNGYTLTFSGVEPQLAPEVASAVISTITA